MGSMKLAALTSGGKDSTLAMYLAKEAGHEIACLVTIKSRNPDSYMFHTPSVSSVRAQAEAMDLPLIERETAGGKELELADLEAALRDAKERFSVGGVVTGAVESVYQSGRIGKLCRKLGLRAVNPLWHMDQTELLEELTGDGFEVVVTAVAAEGLDRSWLGRRIDGNFIRDVGRLRKKHGISPAGEGGEFETFVLNCPLFSRKLEIRDRKISGSGDSWRMELTVR